eukprot:193060_1
MHEKSPNLLFVHKEIIEFDLKLLKFNQHYNETKKFILSISTPDIKDYEKWGVDEMIQWISMLDNGQYVEYLNILKIGFLSDNITGDCLPEIDKQCLRVQPFNIQNFKHRLALEKHFKSLKTCIQKKKHENDEGNTPYI